MPTVYLPAPTTLPEQPQAVIPQISRVVIPPLTTQPQGLTRPSTQQINNTAPRTPPNISINSGAAYRQLAPLYGATRVVGRPGLIREKSGAWILLYVLGRGPWENIDTLYINNDGGTDVSSNSGGATFTNTALFGSGGSARIFEGTSGQDVGGDFMTAFVASFTDTLSDPGVVCIGMELSPLVHREPPRIECDCQGYNQILDPRTSTTGYTANAALILADYITNSDWGHNATIDWDSVGTAADYADETLGADARFETNLLLDRVQSTADWIKHLQVYSGCFIQELGGTFYLITDKPRSKTFDVGPNIIIQGTGSIRKGLGRRNRPSDVSVLWYDKANNVDKEAFAVGGTTGQISRIRAPGIIAYGQAHRMAISHYNHLITEDLFYSCVARDEALQFELADVHAITDTENGLADKYMSLTAKRMVEPGRWALEYSEYQETAYSNSVATDPVTVDTTLPNPNSVPTLTGLTATAENSLSSTNSLDIQVRVTWTDPAWLFTDHVHVFIDDTDATPDRRAGADRVEVGTNETVFTGLKADTNYKVYARIISRSGAAGTYATATVTTFQNLVSLYDFEGASPDYLDDSISGFTLTESGDITGQKTGKVGSHAVEIKQTLGVTYMNTTADGIANMPPPWTILGWVKQTQAVTASSGDVIGIVRRWGSDTTNDVFVLEQQETGIFVRYREIDDSLSSWDTSKTLVTSTWHFIALSYNDGVIRFKFDSDNIIYRAANLKEQLTSSDLRFGNGTDGIIEVDHWRVYRDVLTAEALETIRSAEA